MQRIYQYRIVGGDVLDGYIKTTKPIEDCAPRDTKLEVIFIEDTPVFRISNTFVLDWNGATYRFGSLDAAISELRRLKTTL